MTVCEKPFAQGSVAFPCGRCLPCRVRKKREWQNRITLERMAHGDASFVTLTYDPQHVPADGSLSPEDLQLWLKRLRKRMVGTPLRFFGVGEYGERTFRPHYHVILFGMRDCPRGGVKLHDAQRECSCFSCSIVRDTWGKGHISVGSVTLQSAGYVAGYCVKKLTDRRDTRLKGRHPEFARMSRRPGIGVPALAALAETLVESGWNERLVDVPVGYMMGEKLYPYGRYLRRNLRKLVGRDEKTPDGSLLEWQAKLWDLYVASRSSEKSFSQLVAEACAGDVANAHAISNIYKKRVTI